MNRRLMRKLCVVGLVGSCAWAYADQTPVSRDRGPSAVFNKVNIRELLAQLQEVEEAIAAVEAALQELYDRYEAIVAELASIVARLDVTTNPDEIRALTDKAAELRAELEQISYEISMAEAELEQLQAVRQNLLAALGVIFSWTGGMVDPVPSIPAP